MNQDQVHMDIDYEQVNVHIFSHFSIYWVGLSQTKKLLLWWERCRSYLDQFQTRT